MNERDLTDLFLGVLPSLREELASLSESPEGFVYEIELPGYKKDEVIIHHQSKNITITTKSEKRPTILKNFFLSKEPESIEAILEDGILTLKGDWKEAEKPKKIEIRGG